MEINTLLQMLVPAHVDHESGYRYYVENQLTDANRIQALKSMRLGLSTIKEVKTSIRTIKVWLVILAYRSPQSMKN